MLQQFLPPPRGRSLRFPHRSEAHFPLKERYYMLATCTERMYIKAPDEEEGLLRALPVAPLPPQESTLWTTSPSLPSPATSIKAIASPEEGDPLRLFMSQDLGKSRSGSSYCPHPLSVGWEERMNRIC